MQLFDTITLGDAQVTRDGYLVTDARIARTGIQVYAGREVGKPEMDVVRVYRPESEVFHQDAMASFTHRPITIDHPSEAVTASNWKKHAVGLTGDIVSKDGGFVRVPMTLMDQAAIDTVRAGKRELSCGYTCDLKWEAGTTPEGEAYDAIQTNIRGNHLAIVGAGRAGSDCRIGDEGAPHSKGQDMTLQKVTVDGITVEMSDTAAQVVSKIQKQLSDAIADNLRLTTDHAAALKAKDTEIAQKDAEIEKLKSEKLTDAQLDALVTARADVIGKAKAIVADVKTEGLSIPAIRRAVVSARLGDAAVKDKSDDYVEARFDLLADAAKGTDPVRQAIIGDQRPANDSQSQQLGDASTEYQRMLERDAQAWKKGA